MSNYWYAESCSDVLQKTVVMTLKTVQIKNFE